MAGEPGLSEIVTTTLRYREKTLADNVTRNILLFRELAKAGNVKPTEGGRSIVEPLEYAENGTVSWYSGPEQIAISASSVITAAEFDWKQIAGSCLITGLEEVQNSGKQAVIDLISSRVKNLERTLKNYLGSGVYATGTGNGGKELGGLQLLVADNPTTGTVGGIDRSTTAGSFYRSQKYSGTVDGGSAVSATNIESYLNRLQILTTRQGDKPQFGVADNNYWRLLWDAMSAKQHLYSGDTEDGFKKIVFNGMPIYLDGGVYFGGSGSGSGCPSNHIYLLNPEFLRLRYHPARNFTLLNERDPYAQDIRVRIMVWAGAITMSAGFAHGCLIA